MCGKSFDAESFGGVVASVENVDTKFFCHGIGPVWAFASNERIHAFVGGFFEVAASAAGDDADSLADFGSAGNGEGFGIGGASEAIGEFGAGDSRLGLEAEELAVGEEEVTKFFQTERSAELGVVAQVGMSIEGKVVAIDGEVIIQQELQ